jgi:hypothetical protein
VQRLACLLELQPLLLEERMLRLVGRREMRVDRLELEIGASEQLGNGPLQVLMAEPEAVHSRVDLQVIAEASVTGHCGALKRSAGGGTGDRGRQVVFEDACEIAHA